VNLKGEFKGELGRFKKAWLRRLQQAHRDLLWRRGIKGQSVSLELMRGTSAWGRWLAPGRRIQISEELILTQPWSAVLGILGHETAHQLVSDLGGPAGRKESPHGPSFRQMGFRLGLDPFYLEASVDLSQECPRPWPDPDRPPARDESLRVLEKVKKLLALSGSPVQAEAQAAMNAAARLMARHNLEVLERAPEVTDYEYRTIELKTARLSTRLALTAHILSRHFFVETIFVPGYNPRTDVEEKCLELMGRPENTRLAEHVFHFLMERSESLWRDYHRGHRGGGLTARNSFIIGLLEGFNAKLDQAAAEERSARTGGPAGFSALVLARDQGLADYVRHRHPRLSSVRGGRRRYCAESDQAGQEAGRALNFNRPLADWRKQPPGGPSLLSS
jgi:hypothetical protein